MVTHFFNPRRYMKLLELVAGPETDADVLKRASQRSARTCSARASCAARTRRTSSATASALHVDDDDDPPDARATASRPRTSTRSPASPMAHPKSATLPHRGRRRPRHRSATSPTTATTRSPTTRTATSSRCPPTSATMIEKKHPRRQDQGRLLQARRGRATSRRSIRRPASTAPKGGDEAIAKATQGARARSRIRASA